MDHDMGHKSQTMIDYAFADLEGNARNVKEMKSPLRLALRSEIHLHLSIFSNHLQSYLSNFCNFRGSQIIVTTSSHAL